MLLSRDLSRKLHNCLSIATFFSYATISWSKQKRSLQNISVKLTIYRKFIFLPGVLLCLSLRSIENRTETDRKPELTFDP